MFQLTEDPHTAAWAPLGLAVLGSVRLSLQDLLARPAQAITSRRAQPTLRLPTARVEAPPPGQRMSTAWALQCLADARRRDSVVVEEAPSARAVMHHHLPIFEPETFYTMCSGGLGHGLPAAVGVALAQPGRRVIALVGDGSAMYAIQALWSAAQLALPITIVILKNRRYAALREFAPSFGFAPGAALAGCDLPDLDFVALAAGHGCAGVHVADAQALPGVLTRALQSAGPLLVEIEVA